MLRFLSKTKCSIFGLVKEFDAIQKLLAFLITSTLEPHLEHGRLVAGLVRGVKSEVLHWGNLAPPGLLQAL